MSRFSTNDFPCRCNPAVSISHCMRLIGVFLQLASLALVSARPVQANCENISAGKSFWVRLLDPVASYSSKPGTFVRAVLIQSPDCDGAPVFPAGLQLDGRVLSARRVGIGLVHDTASLEIQFD